MLIWNRRTATMPNFETTKKLGRPLKRLTCFAPWQKCCLNQQKQQNALNWKLLGSTFYTQLQPATVDLTALLPFFVQSGSPLHGDCPAVKGLRLHDTICEPHGLPWQWRGDMAMRAWNTSAGGWAKLTTQHGWEPNLQALFAPQARWHLQIWDFLQSRKLPMATAAFCSMDWNREHINRAPSSAHQ